MTIKQTKVHFIAGKGGVGRTTIAEALAAKCAVREKTLLVTFKKEDTLESNRIPVITCISPKLFLLDFSAEEAMREYLALKITSVPILEKFFGNNLFRAFCSAAPALSDLARLGKIWFHADPINQEKAIQFDKIIVDMPSSGFVPRFLSMGATVQKAVKVGPLAHEAGLINEYFSKPENALVHIVTLMEEMVVNETLELLAAQKKESSVKLGMIFANRVLIIDDKKAKKVLHDLPSSTPLLRSFLQNEITAAEELRILLERLTTESGSSPVLIPDFLTHSGPELKEKIMEVLP